MLEFNWIRHVENIRVFIFQETEKSRFPLKNISDSSLMEDSGIFFNGCSKKVFKKKTLS